MKKEEKIKKNKRKKIYAVAENIGASFEYDDCGECDRVGVW